MYKVWILFPISTWMKVNQVFSKKETKCYQLYKNQNGIVNQTFGLVFRQEF